MNKISIQYFSTPHGEMILGSYGNKLCMADWRSRKNRESIDRRLKKGLSAIFVEEESRVLKLAKVELEAYFQSLCKTFDIPLLLVGTEFQKSVWHKLMEIPFGTTASYLDIAKSIHNEKAVQSSCFSCGCKCYFYFHSLSSYHWF